MTNYNQQPFDGAVNHAAKVQALELLIDNIGDKIMNYREFLLSDVAGTRDEQSPSATVREVVTHMFGAKSVRNVGKKV